MIKMLTTESLLECADDSVMDVSRLLATERYSRSHQHTFESPQMTCNGDFLYIVKTQSGLGRNCVISDSLYKHIVPEF